MLTVQINHTFTFYCQLLNPEKASATFVAVLICLSVFTAVSLPIAELDMPMVVKRLDARYDWLPRWGQQTYQLVDVGTGCESSPSIGGAVAWVSEGNCSFFDKVSKPSLLFFYN